MNPKDLIKLTVSLLLMGSNAILSHYASGPREDRFRTVQALRLGGCVVLLMAAFLFVRNLLCFAEKNAHHTPLTVRTLFTHVYGLGLFVFVLAYCLTGLSNDSTVLFFSAITVLSVDDVFERTRDRTLKRSVLLLSALLAGVSVVASSAQGDSIMETFQATLEEKWLVLVYGAAVPVVAPYIFIGIRARRQYNPLTIYDFVNFAMPFAALLGGQTLLFVGMIPEGTQAPAGNATELPSNATAAQAEPSYAPYVCVPLLALNTILVTLLVIQSILHYSTVDFLASLATVTSFKEMAVNTQGPWTALAFVAAGLSFSLRVYASCQDEGDQAESEYPAETEAELAEREVFRRLDAQLHDLADEV